MGTKSDPAAPDSSDSLWRDVTHELLRAKERTPT